MSRLQGDVNKANALLKGIGSGVNLDMTSVVEKQVKDMLARFKNEIQNASTQASKSLSQMGDGAKSSATEIDRLISSTQKLNRDGSITVTQKGYDELNRAIVEVTKNGQLMTRTMSADSPLAQEISQANKLYLEQIG